MNPTSRRVNSRDESGQIAGIEGVAFGFLIFVVGALIIANGWALIDGKAAASAAAREATRSIVESDAATREEAVDDAVRIADETLRGYGRRLGERGRVVPEVVDFRRCGRVTIVVEYDVPFAALPIIGARGRMFTAVGRHSEIVDPYRTGLPGVATCPS